MRKRSGAAFLAIIIATSLLPAFAAESGETPRSLVTPPGQVKIVTINAQQNAVLGIKRFENMLELIRSMRHRPAAFDGGFGGAVSAPDVVVTQEVRTSNIEIFEHIMGHRFPHNYTLAGAPEATSQIIYNPDTVTLIGEPIQWSDVCLLEQNSGKKTNRIYEIARFTENRTGTPFTVAAIHLYKNYSSTGQEGCRERNITTMQTLLAAETGPVFAAGDFNRRAVEKLFECDPNERSAPQMWYSLMTDGVSPFADAVRSYHRGRHRSMRNQWTHEQYKKKELCNGKVDERRTRIDYIFARGAAVAEAGVDHPGWSGGAPGTKHPDNHKYSDHRFVWGRFILSGPPKPTGLAAEERRAGRVLLSWKLVEGATEYRIYRAIGKRGFSALAKVAADAASYKDDSTEHGVAYRYTIAPLGPGGGQGLESRPAWATADARGPQIVGLYPARGATGVDPRIVLRVTFSERVKPASVTQDRIRLFRGTKRLEGTVKRVSARVLEFDPRWPLKRGATHRVTVKPVRDKLNNVGGATYDWKFTVKPRVKKKRR